MRLGKTPPDRPCRCPWLYTRRAPSLRPNLFRRAFPGLYKPLIFLYNTLVSALKETGRPGACPRSEPGAVKARRAEGLPDHSGASCAKAQALSPRYRGSKRAAHFSLSCQSGWYRGPHAVPVCTGAYFYGRAPGDRAFPGIYLSCPTMILTQEGSHVQQGFHRHELRRA